MGKGVGETVGWGAAVATPLSQTFFFPDLTQVKVLPLETLVVPIFLQVAPGFTALNEGVDASKANESTVAIARPNFMD